VEFSRQFNDQTVAQDVLRAAVVLNHAYLEDMLRTLANNLLSEGDESVLNQVPLSGLGTGRAEKFLLGKLAKHRGKTVDAVIRESVSEHVERSTYSDTREIAQLLTQVGFKVSDHNAHFPMIQEMVERRHLIVHRADRVKAPDSETYTLGPIQAAEVNKWLQATVAFIQSLMQPLFLRLYPPEELAKMFNISLRK
jgi:DNA-binding PadR family transcriptional regulator